MKPAAFVLVVATLGLSACVFSIPAQPSAPPASAIQTSVAQTLTAQPASGGSATTQAPLAAPTGTPTSTTGPTSTPSPTFGPTLPTPTFTSPAPVPQAPPANNPPAQTPGQFIRYYFSNINVSNYTLTWSLLTSRFKNNMNGPAAGGYQGYVDYWNTVHNVEVQNVVVVSQNGGYAVATVYAAYHYNDDSIVNTIVTYSLIYDYGRRTWLFDSPGAPYSPPPSTTQTPVQFIYYYYTNINNGNYPLTWSLLTDRFKAHNNGGDYQNYINYWNTIYSVYVQSVYVISQSDGYATVKVKAIYYFTNGSSAGTSVNFTLIYDYTRGTWLFDSP